MSLHWMPTGGVRALSAPVNTLESNGAASGTFRNSAKKLS